MKVIWREEMSYYILPETWQFHKFIFLSRHSICGLYIGFFAKLQTTDSWKSELNAKGVSSGFHSTELTFFMAASKKVWKMSNYQMKKQLYGQSW